MMAVKKVLSKWIWIEWEVCDVPKKTVLGDGPVRVADYLEGIGA
jgi:hypothetical protein